jgi:hypothetical protein
MDKETEKLRKFVPFVPHCPLITTFIITPDLEIPFPPQ